MLAEAGTDLAAGAPALWATLGIAVTVLSILLTAIVRATRAWSRLEYDLRSVIRDFQTHIATERAERVEITSKHAHDMEQVTNRLTLIERELVRVGGGGGVAGPA